MRFAALALFVSLNAAAQTDTPKPVFEAASIKLTASSGGGGHSHENSDPGMLRGSMTLKAYIMAAYGVNSFQVTGGPDWIDSSTYEIVAKMEQAGGEARIHQALQTLLAERFQLKFHRETRESRGYELTLAKSGFKLKPVPATSNCGTSARGGAGAVSFTATCIDMAAFATYLSRRTGLPVSDQTRVEGLYSFALEWNPDDLRAAPEPDRPSLPSLYTVLSEKLGLRLESRKVALEMLVVDSAERPSEN